MRAIRSILYFTTAFALSACTMGPDFERPDFLHPEKWFGGDRKADTAEISVAAPEPIQPEWWNTFGDPELTALEKRVVAANFDVRTATIRFAESRAQRQITAAQQFPQINGDALYQRELPSQKGVISLLSGGGTAAQPAGKGPSGGSLPLGGLAVQPFNLWQFGFDASWELDLWGKVRRSVEAADASLEASADARRAVLLSSLAEVARDYLQLRGTQAELRIARENLDAARQNYDLTRQRADKGLSSELDATNASAAANSAAAVIPPLETQIAQAINALSFLLGEAPRSLAAELSEIRDLPALPPRVPIGLPSELARRRPDIRQAEAVLHAQTAEIGVAVASFYPSVSLSGNFDFQALRFSQLANWDARTYGLGPSISVPIFEGGRLTGNLELTKAQQQEAALAYQRAVLGAFREIDDALTAYQAEQRRLGDIDKAVAANRHALDLARDQYAHGLATFLQVLTVQQQLLQTSQQAAESRTNVETDLVALYKALGGGWETTFPE